MRAAPSVVLALALALALPVVAANTRTGNGVAVGDAWASVGLWDLYHVHVADAPVTGSLTLSWARPVGIEQFDVTIWKPGADKDGALSPNKVLYASWGPTPMPHRTLAFTLPPAGLDYVVTVEPTTSAAAAYSLASQDVWIQDKASSTYGYKVTLP